MQKTILFLSLLAAVFILHACNNSSTSDAEANAWITADQEGHMTLLGKPVATLEDLQAALYDTISRMDPLPDSIPVYFKGEVLMGMRGEIRTIIAESLARADARKACEAVIHGFYTWYGPFAETTEIDFVDDAGAHLMLDTLKLDAYLGKFRATGFVGEAFMQGQKAFYRNCEKLWQNEPKDEPPSCLDADPYFCAQDWDLASWTKAPVTVDLSGEEASAAMEADTRVHHFNLVKENGKWVISKLGCDM